MHVLRNKLTRYTCSVIIITIALIASTIQRRLILVAVLPKNDSYPFSIRKVRPVLETAIDIIYARTPGNDTIEVIYTDSGPDVAQATHSAYTIHTNLTRRGEKIGAFLGPVIDEILDPLARQASMWGVPVLTSGGISAKFSLENHHFSTLIRLGFVADTDMMYMLEDFLHKYRWTRSKFLHYHTVGLHYGMNATCEYISEELHRRAIDIQAIDPESEVDSEFGYAEQLEIAFATIGNDYEKMLEAEVGEEYAIVILCAPPDVVRSIMITAHRLNFTNGNYVFIVFDLYRTEAELRRPWYRADDPSGNDEAKASYEFVINIGTRTPTGAEYTYVASRIHETAELLYHDSADRYSEYNLTDTLSAFYDALYIFSTAWIEVGSQGHVLEYMFTIPHTGITGDSITLDQYGARFTEYSIYQTSREEDIPTGNFHVMFNYIAYSFELVQLRPVDWFGFHNRVPPPKPICPYNTNCEERVHVSVLIAVPGLVVSIVVIATLVARRYRRGSTLKKLEWRVHWEDVTLEQEEKRRLELGRLSAPFTPTIVSTACSIGHRFTEVGFVRNTRISIKFLRRETFVIDLAAMSQLKTLVENRNDNLCRFVGVCLDLPFQSILTEYCDKGSLSDVLKNDRITLDWTFRFSLAKDIAKGMTFLHSSVFQSHGKLTTNNCVIDARFVLKITDFGLHFLRDEDSHFSDTVITYEKYNKRLWTAPELLRHPNLPNGTKKGDIYSFAIICQEIIYRMGTFYIESDNFISAKDKYGKVRRGVEPYMRPTLKGHDCYNIAFYDLIVRAWSEETHERPTFPAILDTLENISYQHGISGTGSVLDSLLLRMETYAINLETQVETNTNALNEEKHRVDDILHMMLPRTVADQLVRGETVPPESYDLVTIFVSDIVGLAALSASCKPNNIIGMLNDLYKVFESIIHKHDVYKVKTIGDQYVIVSGLPVRNDNRHAAEIAWMAIAIQTAVNKFRVRFRPKMELKVRIGVHSGPVSTGVVGNKLPRYCVFGNTMKTAALYETKGLPQMIHISKETKEVLDRIGGFDITPREAIEMKPRVKVITYWIRGSTTSRASSSPSNKRSEVRSELSVLSRTVRSRQSGFLKRARRQPMSHSNRRQTGHPRGSRKRGVFPRAGSRQSMLPPGSRRESGLLPGSRRESALLQEKESDQATHTQGSGRRSASPQANEIALPSQTIPEGSEDDPPTTVPHPLFKHRESTNKEEIPHDTCISIRDKPRFHAHLRESQKGATTKHMDRLDELTVSDTMLRARECLSEHAKSMTAQKTSSSNIHFLDKVSRPSFHSQHTDAASVLMLLRESDTGKVKKRSELRKGKRPKAAKTIVSSIFPKNVRVKHSKVSPSETVISKSLSVNSKALTKTASSSTRASKKNQPKKVTHGRSKRLKQIQDTDEDVESPESLKQTEDTQGFIEASHPTHPPEADAEQHAGEDDEEIRDIVGEDVLPTPEKKAPRHSRLLLATEFAPRPRRHSRLLLGTEFACDYIEQMSPF